MIEYNRLWYLANQDKHKEYVGTHKVRAYTCRHCGKGEPEVQFYIRKVSGRYYRRYICYGCDQIRREKYPTREASIKRERVRRAAKERVDRLSSDRRYWYILKDSKSADKARRRDNDLDYEFIKTTISTGCAYCGDLNGKMTLDRVDNSIGHLKTNVIGACMQCNWFRRDMPFAAWELLLPALQTARARGLLDDWNAGTRKADCARKETARDREDLHGL